MLIQPDTFIRLIKNCPLDNTYRHTLYFDSEASQVQYFKNTLQGIPFNKQSYQRFASGVIHVQEKAENLYDCNYLMFQNSAFGNKYFYAFITEVEYVNNVSSKVYYEIDVLQTWYFNYELGVSFVEREHSVTDIIGENLVPENLELGEYVSSSDGRFTEVQQLSIVVASTMKIDDEGELNLRPGEMYGRVYSGLYFSVFHADSAGVEELKKFIRLDGLLPGGSSIVSIFMMPTAFVTDTLLPKSYFKSIAKRYGQFGTFTPNNNKLYTYPYNFLYVTNMQGNNAAYPYEFFGEIECTFMLVGDTSCNPGVILIPRAYKGLTSNYDESMTLTGFPQCAYTDDAFAAYLSQIASAANVSTLAHNVMQNIAGTLSPVTTAIGVAGVLARSVGTLLSPRQSKGVSNNATLVAAEALTFEYMNKRITEEFARIIDGYFDVYGYACHKVKKPNISSRPHWNYTKTINCNIIGAIPASDMSKIKHIFDSGITFWKNGSEVGNYSLDNTPV